MLRRARDNEIFDEIERRGWRIERTIKVIVEENLKDYAHFRHKIEKYYGIKLCCTRQEIRILECLLERAPHVVSMDQIIEAVYFDDPQGGPLTARNVMGVCISRLRKKLAPTSYRIETDGHVGFSLNINPWKYPPSA